MENKHEVVRMVLWDYDAAPDGCGTYKKLDAVFSSFTEALKYRNVYLHGMYWGHIETLDGNTIAVLEEENDHDDYNPYEDYDED